MTEDLIYFGIHLGIKYVFGFVFGYDLARLCWMEITSREGGGLV